MMATEVEFKKFSVHDLLQNGLHIGDVWLDEAPQKDDIIRFRSNDSSLAVRIVQRTFPCETKTYADNGAKVGEFGRLRLGVEVLERI